MTPEGVFLLLLDRSLAAAWLVLAILLLRPFLRRVSRSVCCAVWGLVAFRLLCPVSLPSIFSLIPRSESMHASLTEVSSGSPAQKFLRVFALLWLLGVALFALYALGSYLYLRWLVRESVRKEDGVWLCDRIGTPFILGVFRPRILLPVDTDEGDMPYILAHERAHLARYDHWRKPVAYALLAVFWFQPALWAAYFLLGRDVEFACDERAIRALGTGNESKASYAKALLRGSVPRGAMLKLSCPLAFGGLQTRKRVQSVLQYRTPAVSLLLATALLCGAVGICFLTDPKGDPIGGETAGSYEAPVVEAELELPADVPSGDAPSAEEPPLEPVEKPAEQPEEKPSGKAFIATSVKKHADGTSGETSGGESEPLYPHPEIISYEDWMAMYHPSQGVTEETWRLCYVLNHRIQMWYDGERFALPDEIAEAYGTTDFEALPSIIIYESVGEEDSTETIEVWFSGTDESGVRREWSQTVTIEIPAGEVAFCVLDPGFEVELGGFAIVAGSYGDLYAESPIAS